LNKQGRLTAAPGEYKMDNMQYLFAAYLAIWIVLSLYLFSLHSREKKLRDEVQRLKAVVRSLKTGVSD